ncbi:MAG: hypothetical protein DRR42_08485, partial [Gammaproteobacteria bacterium]
MSEQRAEYRGSLSTRPLAKIEDQDIIDKILTHLLDKDLTYRYQDHHPGRHLAHGLLSLGRNPALQHSISKHATEQLVGIESFV